MLKALAVFLYFSLTYAGAAPLIPVKTTGNRDLDAAIKEFKAISKVFVEEVEGLNGNSANTAARSFKIDSALSLSLIKHAVYRSLGVYAGELNEENPCAPATASAIDKKMGLLGDYLDVIDVKAQLKKMRGHLNVLTGKDQICGFDTFDFGTTTGLGLSIYNESTKTITVLWLGASG